MRQRLLALAGPETVARVDIINIDKLASRVVAESQHDAGRQWIDAARAVQEWEKLLGEQPGPYRWDAEFLHAEWSHVILGQTITSRTAYFRAGRGRAISREDRAEIWELVERFVMRLDGKRLWTYRQGNAAGWSSSAAATICVRT